ncbi:YCF48-related protein [Alicyclobacillus acidiphilus]|uniref:YCF48-related protein n=1 Tax=Alicyclobacillus acidiphilus TaxID=182455 RepID=UPI000834300F|nr:YCF48-related protein [Alicyclobacillus acidiphilus]
MTPKRLQTELQRGHRPRLSSDRKAALRDRLIAQMENDANNGTDFIDELGESDQSAASPRRPRRFAPYGYSAAGLLVASGIAGVVAWSLPGSHSPQSLAQPAAKPISSFGTHQTSGANGTTVHHAPTAQARSAMTTAPSRQPSRQQPGRPSSDSAPVPATKHAVAKVLASDAVKGNPTEATANSYTANTKLIANGLSTRPTNRTMGPSRSNQALAPSATAQEKAKSSTNQSGTSSTAATQATATDIGSPVSPASASSQTTSSGTESLSPTTDAQAATNSPTATNAQAATMVSNTAGSTNTANASGASLTSNSVGTDNDAASGGSNSTTQFIASNPSGASEGQSASSTAALGTTAANSPAAVNASSGAGFSTGPFSTGTWAVKGNYVYATSDGGKTWVDVTPQDVVHSDAMITSVDFPSSDEGLIAVRQSGQSTIYVSADGGQSWQESSLPTSLAGDVRQLDMIDDSIGYAAITSDTNPGTMTSLWETVDGGQHWANMYTASAREEASTPRQPSSLSLLYDPFQLVAFGSANVGYRWMSTSTGWAPGYTTTAGATWTTQIPELPVPRGIPSGATEDIDSLPMFFDGVGVWPVLYESSKGNTLVTYESADEGLNWSISGTASLKTAEDAVFISPKVGWAVDPVTNSFLQTSDGGATWTKVPSSVSISDFTLVVPTSSATAIGIEPQADGTVSLLSTTNGGKTWSPAAAPKSFSQSS